MHVSRVVVRNFRNFLCLDVSLQPRVTCIVGENNTGKTNLFHALRLAIDANLSSRVRTLTGHDFHSGIDPARPQQVVVSLEFSDYQERENECALVGCWEVDDDLARITYRFRPKQRVREDIEAEVREPTGLTLEDYHWEITGGGDVDPRTVAWNEEIGSSVRFADLQAFQVVFLPALRDVRQDLRNSYVSPLGRLLSESGISEEEKEKLVGVLRQANRDITDTPTIREAGEAIDKAFSATAGEAFQMDVRLGMSDPSFAAIAKGLTVLLSNEAIQDFEPERNGLGLNNILYVSLLVEYFERRVAKAETAGQLLLIEEPEAHVHPQLQRVLYNVLAEKPFQTVVTTHSTHVSSHAPLESFVVLTNNQTPATASAVVAESPNLGGKQIADLERYLDATRSTLLFARKVVLVEGPAELFLIPVLVKQVLGLDLDSLGITVVPIYGVHFDVYARLFGEGMLPKKCAIIADGDLAPSDATDDPDGEDEIYEAPDLAVLENEYVRVFQCKTTFERALTIRGLLPVLAEAASEVGATRTASRLKEADEKLEADTLGAADKKALMNDLRTRVLNMAKRVGKARFAQVASKHAHLASGIPKYIREAVEWLTD